MDGYYVKERCQGDQWGFNFQAAEGDLAKELQKIKLQNEKKQREVDAMLANDKEIQSVRRKIEASYLSKERAKQLAETQYRKLGELVHRILSSDTRSRDRSHDAEIETTPRLALKE